MTKLTSKRYIERKLSVSKLIKMIPDKLLENIAKDTTVDYQVKHLNAALMFKLFLFSILKSERLSSRFMEFFYNSSEFKIFSGKGAHQTRHSSIADRMRTIDSKYFETVFENIAEILEKRFRKKTKKVKEILRFDSTMVAVGAGLIKQGMQVGKKAEKSNGKKQLKFSIGQKGMLPSSVQLFTGQSHLSEDIALREAIIKNVHSQESIVVFDRGLQKRGTFVEFDESDISFVTRANNYIKYEKQEVFKVIKGRETETLVFEEDILVYLFDHYNKKINKPFRLIKGRMKKTDEPIYFLTNITDLTARKISEVYQRRWDIEVFFRFIKQELNFSNLVTYNENGIKVMMYMILITAMLILIYKKVNNIEGYKIAKLSFIDDLQMEITKAIVESCGGDPKLMKKLYGTE